MAGWQSAPIVGAARPVVFTDTGQQANPEQQQTVNQLNAAGGYDPSPSAVGTSRQPYGLRDGDAPPTSGFYLDQHGLVHQAGDGTPAPQPQSAAPPIDPSQPPLPPPPAMIAPADTATGQPSGGSWYSAPIQGVDPSSPTGKAQMDATTELAKMSPADMGAWKAVQGAAFNFGDEAAAGVDAAKVGVANLFGQGPGYGMGDAYHAKLDAIRTSEGQFDHDHPWLSTGLTAAGAMANPLTYMGGEFIGGAETGASAMFRSAGVGAGEGALAGAGAGTDVGSRFTGGLQSGEFGASGGAAAAGTGAALSPVVRRILSRPSADGAFAAQDALRKLGIDPFALPASTQAAVDSGVAAGQHPADVAVAQAAQSLPVPVPLSRGQITGDPAQQLTENMILRGARGPNASNTAQMFRQEQQAAMRGNVSQIGADMTGGFPVARDQAGASVSDALSGARVQAQARVDGAYDAARNAPDPAYLSPSSALQLTRSARSALTDTFDPLAVPNVAREVDRLGNALVPWAKKLPPGVNPNRVSGLSGTSPADVRAIFDARARLTALQTDPRSPDFAAAGAVKGAIDNHVNQAVSDDLFSGDPQTVQLWRNAIGARRDLGRVFQSGDLVQKLTDTGPGGVELKVDPNDAAKYIFGRSAIGWTGRVNLYRDLSKVRDTLGADSSAWNQLRSAAFGQIARAGDGPMEAGSPQFSGAGFAQAWGKAKADDPQLLSTLFSPTERNTIDTFAGVAARATKPVTGGDNASNSGITTARAVAAMRRLPFKFIEAVPGINHMADMLDHAAANNAIRQATYKAQPRMVAPPVAAQAGAAFGLPTGRAAYESRRKGFLGSGPPQ